MQQQAPTPPATPNAPAIANGNATVVGAPTPSAADVYQGFRAQRRELRDQLESLEGQRDNISRELQQETVTGADRKGLEARIATVDERIAATEKQIAEADAQVARTAAVPGATIQPPAPPRDGPPEEAWVVGTIFMFIFFLPMSIAFSRRIWRKSAKIVTNIPKELSDRLMRVEQTVEATAIEIERIGEGQRFMTRVFTEGQGAHAVPANPQHAIPSGRPGDVRP